MDIASIQKTTFYITISTAYIVLVVGNIGCICNFITFTSKQLRQNSCGWYILMSTLFDFLYINFGLFTKLANEQYGSTLENKSIAYCRIRSYLTWVLPCFGTGYLVLASIDRCLSASKSTKLRSFSQIKVAHRMTCVPIILYSITSSHQLFYFVIQSECVPLPGTYSYFLSIYSIVWTSLIPQSTMLIFSLITYHLIRKSRQRLIHSLEEVLNLPQRSRMDSQLIRVTLIQVISSLMLLNIRTIYYSYSILSKTITKTAYRNAVERLLLQLSSLIFFINFSKSFFTNTLSSKLFRQIFKKRLILFYERLKCCHIWIPTRLPKLNGK